MNIKAVVVFLQQLLYYNIILVSLTYWKQPNWSLICQECVVICFLFSIFDVLETTRYSHKRCKLQL